MNPQMEGDRPRVLPDLDGATLVDGDVVRFLTACEQRELNSLATYGNGFSGNKTEMYEARRPYNWVGVHLNWRDK